MQTDEARWLALVKIMLVIIAGFISSLACARLNEPVVAQSGAAQLGQSGGIVDGTLRHQGLVRNYSLFIPSSYQPAGQYPLILALHGGGGTGRSMCALKAGIQTLADAEGFIVVCPQGLENHWNDGRHQVAYRAHQEAIDDVGFLMALVEHIGNEYAISENQVFVTGYSNGGMMSYRLACERSSDIRAIAAGIANLPVDLDCQPDQPIPVMILNGTEDPLMPYQGGQVGTRRNPLGAVLSTEATADFWASENGCEPEPAVETLPAQVATDQTRLRQTTFSNCQSNSTVVLFTVVGGGHTWPGGSQYAPEFLIGPVSSQANAAELIWNFFRATIH